MLIKTDWFATPAMTILTGAKNLTNSLIKCPSLRGFTQKFIFRHNEIMTGSTKLQISKIK
jgi:hypothetical protein